MELARQATSPRTLAQIAQSPNNPTSPPPTSAGSYGGGLLASGGSPVLRSQHIGLPHDGAHVAPATFTPLPDDIYLPFVDRPSEVAHLISLPPDSKLFALLAQTLPKKYAGEGGDPLDVPDATTVHLPRDPSLWTYAHLIHHLTQVDRDAVADPMWTFATRKCIISHSELIWERVKGAFGVPPELDFDYDFTRRHHRSSSHEKHHAKMRKLRAELREGAPKQRPGQPADDNESAIEDDEDEDGAIESEEFSEDEGPGAAGHWENWDAVIESPIHARGGMNIAGGESRRRGSSVHDVGGVVIGSFNDPTHASSVGIVTEGPSPPLGAVPGDEDDDDADFISIEPLLAPSPDTSGAFGANPPPPLSSQARELLDAGVAGDTPAAEGLGLGDIAEGEEDEDEEDGGNAGKDKDTNPEPKEEDVISPSQIQGLLISTHPVHAGGSYGVGGLFVPHHDLPFHPGEPTVTMASPMPISPAAGGEENSGSGHRTLAQALEANTISQTVGRSHSRTSSFSSMTGVSIGPFSRSESTGNLAALMATQHGYNPQNYTGSDAGDSTGYGSDWSVGATAGGSTAGGHPDLVNERLPGQPLFVSNFARLNGCPTLKGTVTSPPGRPGRFKMKQRTGSIGAASSGSSAPSSNLLGPHSAGQGENEVFSRTRTLSHG